MRATLISLGTDFKLYSEWGKQKGPDTSFATVTSANVEISPKNFLTINFNPFATLMEHAKTIPTASHKLLNMN